MEDERVALCLSYPPNMSDETAALTQSEAERLTELFSPQNMARHLRELDIHDQHCLSCHGMQTRTILLNGGRGGMKRLAPSVLAP